MDLAVERNVLWTIGGIFGVLIVAGEDAVRGFIPCCPPGCIGTGPLAFWLAATATSTPKVSISNRSQPIEAMQSAIKSAGCPAASSAALTASTISPISIPLVRSTSISSEPTAIVSVSSR